jgi:uncharacterized Zn-binding protein involved in type VI secretion
MTDDKDDKPVSGSGGEGGFGSSGEKNEGKKKEESGFKPTVEQKDEVRKEEGHKRERKVTIYEKELVPKQEGYLGPSAGDRQEGLSGGVGYYEAGIKSELSYNLDKKEATLDVVDAKGKISILHGQAKGSFDLGSMVMGFLGLSPPAPPSPASMAPLAARVTDVTTHGSPLAPGIGSTNVLIGGLPAWRAAMDFHACPIVKGLVPDVGGVVMVGCPIVMINDMMACRMGDMVVEIPGGPNPILMGCSNVMIGSAASPTPPAAPKGTGVTVAGEATGDVGTAEASAKLGVEVADGKGLAVAKADAMAAVLKGTAKGTISIPLWGDHAIVLGGSAEGDVLAVGGKASAEAGYTPDKGWHIGAEAGVSVGAGGSLGFSIGFK